jgi:putative transcriptional regulator
MSASQDHDFASLIRQLRSARGLTQEEFARELDVTVSTMSCWENGRHRPVRAQRNRILSLAEQSGVLSQIRSSTNSVTRRNGAR